MQDTFTPAEFRFKARVLFEGAADPKADPVYIYADRDEGCDYVLPWTSNCQFGSFAEFTHESLKPRLVDPEPLHFGH
jgi:hypothetical protein